MCTDRRYAVTDKIDRRYFYLRDIYKTRCHSDCSISTRNDHEEVKRTKTKSEICLILHVIVTKTVVCFIIQWNLSKPNSE